jgi:hypothetical protein
MPSMAEIGPDFWRVSTPTLTFSSAVSAGNSRMFWKVRATPSRLITWVFLPSTDAIESPSRAARVIVPSCGV